MLVKRTRDLVLAGSIILVGSGILVFQGTATSQDTQEKTVKRARDLEGASSRFPFFVPSF